MTAADVQPESATNAGDSPAAERDVPCPLCGYNLRGLTEPRCPECGYRFEWENLLDPTKRLHPYLFEHHPERNVRSFLRTMVGGLLPRRFWRSLQPAMPSRPRRLVIYWLLAALLGFGVLLTEGGRLFYNNAVVQEQLRASDAQWASRAIRTPPTALMTSFDESIRAEVVRAGGPRAWVDARLPPWHSRRFVGQWLREYRWRRELLAPLLYVAWPWLTLATLMVFRASMRRAKVRTAHVLRCALYCCDAAVWLVPMTAFAAREIGLAAGNTRFGPLVSQNYYGLPLLVPLLPALYTGYRLAAAYRFYLRFDRPLATAAASQVIVLLLVTAIIVAMY